MQLSHEFKQAKNDVDRKEQALNSIFEKTLNFKYFHDNSASDIYFERNLLQLADLYNQISNRTDYMYVLPVTHSSKAMMLTHAKDIEKIEPELVDVLEEMKDQIEKNLINDEHQIIIAQTIVGFANLVDSHNKLMLDFTEIMESQNNKGTPPPPSYDI